MERFRFSRKARWFITGEIKFLHHVPGDDILVKLQWVLIAGVQPQSPLAVRATREPVAGSLDIYTGVFRYNLTAGRLARRFNIHTEWNILLTSRVGVTTGPRK